MREGGRVGFSSFIWVQWRGAKDTAALFGAEPLHLSLFLKKLIVVIGTEQRVVRSCLSGSKHSLRVPLASIVVYGTGDVLDWNKNRSTGTKSLFFLVFAGGCCAALKFLFPFSLFFPYLRCKRGGRRLSRAAGVACRSSERAKRVKTLDSLGKPTEL